MTRRQLTPERLEEIRGLCFSAEITRWSIHVMVCRGVDPWEIAAWLIGSQNTSPGWVWCVLRSAGWPVDKCIRAFHLAGWSIEDIAHAVVDHPLRAMMACGFRRAAVADTLRTIAAGLDDGPAAVAMPGEGTCAALAQRHEVTADEIELAVVALDPADAMGSEHALRDLDEGSGARVRAMMVEIAQVLRRAAKPEGNAS